MKASKREALDKILTLLRRDQSEGRSVHELASRTAYSVSSVRNLIGHLRREGYVIRTEATHYFLLEEPNHEQDRA